MKKAAVIGSFVVDLMARTPHLPVPGETVKGSYFKMGPGGKGFNQAIAAGRAGVSLTYITKLGHDAFADVAFNLLSDEKNVDGSKIIISDDAPTGVALISVDEGRCQNEIVVVPGASDTFTAEEIKSFEPLMEEVDYLLVQLEINMDALEALIALAYSKGVKVILNPAPAAPLSDGTYEKLYAITPNETECAFLTGFPCETEEDWEKSAKVFLDKGVENVIITLGEKGSFLADGKTCRRFENNMVDVLDTTGAGDAYNGGLLAGLAKGMSMEEACVYATAVGNLSVTRIGTSVAMPTESEIEAFLEARR
jgi:Sugar kinases, ribokinase family